MAAARVVLTWAFTYLATCNGLLMSRRTGIKSKAVGLDNVIAILQNMMSDFSTQATADENSWQAYQKWSEETETEKREHVQSLEATILSNTALINAKKQDVGRLTTEISNLGSSISETQGSLGELETMRGKEHTQHSAQLQDVTKTIDAVNRAIEILQGHYAATGAALTEIKERVQFALTITNMQASKNPLSSLIQGSPDWLNTDGAKYSSYEKQGGAHGVIGTLNELRSQLDANRQASIETESTAVRDYEEQKGLQTASVERLQGEKSQKSTEKEDASSAITMAEATVSQAGQSKADAQNILTTVAADLVTFRDEFQKRQATRDGEQKATQAALDALQSVSAGAKSGVASFLQLSATKLFKCEACSREEHKLRMLSKTLHSDSLLQVANELAQRSHGKGGLDPSSFDPIKTLLGNLITRLEDEASAEGSHEEWCATEKSSSVTAKVNREETVKQLQAEIDRITVSVEQLATDVTFLTDEIARVNRENEEATTNRNGAHSAFVQAEADHTEVIDAIGKAMNALNSHYNFLQTKHKQSPFESYSSGASSAGSAATMLEDLLQRYSAAKADLITDENNAVTAFDDLMAQNRQFLSDSESTKNDKIAERRLKLQQLTNDKAELVTNFLELKELAKYLQDLRPSCDDIRSTFEERKRRRQEEIDALKQCLAVLSDPSAISR